ncbi:hypothetical protein MW887_004066 [Aspergillus wentii]|nr:hypothetical protein MW887_004066 [Aspergillus wentii]
MSKTEYLLLKMIPDHAGLMVLVIGGVAIIRLWFWAYMAIKTKATFLTEIIPKHAGLAFFVLCGLHEDRIPVRSVCSGSRPFRPTNDTRIGHNALQSASTQRASSWTRSGRPSWLR